MTEQEKIQEEVRLLNLRVDELKAQNEHYKADTVELEQKNTDFKQKAEIAEKHYLELVGLEQEKLVQVENLKKEVSNYESLFNKFRAEATEEEKRLNAIKSGIIKETQHKVDLQDSLFELESKLKAEEGEFVVKYNSLKGFEEELLIKEGLLNRREQMLDLKEKGVKLSK